MTMTKITTSDTRRFQEIDRAVAALTDGQRAAIAEFDALLPNGHIPLTDARDVAGVFAGIKQVAYVSNDFIGPALLKRMGLHRAITSNVAEAYSLDKATVREFKAAVKNAFSHLDTVMPGHKVEGRLLGYPETSTAYFMKRWGNIDTYPMVISKSSEGTLSGEFFQDFILSPKHYAREIRDYSEPLEYATAILLPRTYKKMQRMWRKYQCVRMLKRLVGIKPPVSPIPELRVD